MEYNDKQCSIILINKNEGYKSYVSTSIITSIIQMCEVLIIMSLKKKGLIVYRRRIVLHMKEALNILIKSFNHRSELVAVVSFYA